jgi:hypothetical protein
MMLVVAQPPHRVGHAYWGLVASRDVGSPDERAILCWVDLQMPGLFDRAARPDDLWARLLKYSEILILDPAGYPVDIDARIGSRASAIAEPTASRPEFGLRGGADPEPDIIQSWRLVSRADLLDIRSAELRQVDAAVAAVAQEPDSVHRLRNVLAAIQAWLQSKDGPSVHDNVVQQLRQRMQDDLDDLAGAPEAGRSTTAATHPADHEPHPVAPKKASPAPRPTWRLPNSRWSWSKAPEQASPPDAASTGPLPGPLPGPDGWGADREQAPMVRVDTARFDPATNQAAREPGHLAGAMTVIRYEVRRFQTPAGGWVREYVVNVPVVRSPGIDPAELAGLATSLQSAADSGINRRYTLPRSGDQLHVTVRLTDTPAPGDGDSGEGLVLLARTGRLTDGSAARVPTDQFTWHLDDAAERLLHEIFHFLGLPDRGHDPAMLLRRFNPGPRPAGRPLRRGDAGAVRDGSLMSDGRLTALIQADLTIIEDVADASAIIRSRPARPRIQFSASSGDTRPAEQIEMTEIPRAPGRPTEADAAGPSPRRTHTPPQPAEPAPQGPADQGPADQGPADQGPADQGPADQGPADQGPAGPGDPAFPERESPPPGLGQDRTFPPLFAEEFGGAVQYPMGHLGEFVKLGNALFSDYQAVADLVAGALPPGNESFRQGLADQVKSFLRDKGSHAFAQGVLDRAVPFKVHPNADDSRAARTFTVKLELGDPGKAYQVRGPEIDPAPAGQQRSLPWDSEQVVSAGSSRSVTSSRGVSAGPAGLATGCETPGISLGAASTTTFTSTTSASAAERRYTSSVRDGVDHAFFRFPEGALVVRSVGLPDAAEPAGQRLPVVLAFPENLCPLKGWRPLSAQKLGVTQDQVNRDEVVRYDPARGEVVRAKDASQRIEKLLGWVAAERESVAGLSQLRDEVWERLSREVAEADQEHRSDVADNLTESTVLRRWPDITGPGAVTPVIGRSQHGPRLIIETGLRNVQALTEDDIPVKEENMRSSAVTDAKAESGTLSVSGCAKVKSRARKITVKGKTVRVRGTGQVEGTGSLSSARQESATISYGDARNLIHRGASIRYRAELHVTVKIAGDGAAPESMPTVEGDIVALFRIPKHQQARFESLIREALSPAGGQPPRVDEPGGQQQDRYPTAAIASGKGLGFASASCLAGAEKVLPQILSMIMNLDRRAAWAQPWTGRAYADAFANLSPNFTTQALAAASIAPVAGLHAEWSRPATEGHELISVRVQAIRGPQPASSGRTENATLVICNTTSQGSGSSGDTLISSLTFAGSGGLDFGYDLGGGRSGSFATSGGAGLSITRTAATQAGHSVTRYPITTYTGPVRHWDYDLTFAIDVSVSHEHGTAPADWVPVFANAARNRFAQLTRAPDDGEESIPLLMLGDDESRLSDHKDLTGSVRIGVPEPMTHATPVPQRILDETGAVEVIRDPRRPRNPAADASIWQILGRYVLPRQLQPRQGQLFRTVPMPDVRHYLGTAGHTRLTEDDRVVEIQGAGDVGAVLQELLAAGGISKATHGDLPMKITEPGQLATSMSEGPSVIMTTVVQEGRITNRHATIKIAGYPTRLAPEPADTDPAHDWRVSDPLALSSEETDLGGPLVSSMVIKQWARSLSIAADADQGAGRENVDLNAPVSSYTWSLAPNIRPRTVTDAAATGYQIYERRIWRIHYEDIVWVIAVVFHDKNMVYRSTPSCLAAIVKVRRGITLLRLADPIPDPRRVVTGLPPSGTPRLIRAGQPAREYPPPPAGPPQPPAGSGPPPAGAEPRRAADTRVVPLLPVTPGSREMIPAVPILPIPSVTERLLPLPDPHRPPGAADEGEPLLTAVREELAAHAPQHLEDYWTLEADGFPADRQVPARLQQLFSLDFIKSIIDTVLGGWVIARPTRSVPGASDVVEIWVSGRRVWGSGRGASANAGYKFLESVPAAEIGRDTWGHHIVRAGRPWLFTRSGQTSGQAGPQQTGAVVNPVKQLDKAGGRGTTDAIWDSILLEGADRYGGEVEFHVLVHRTVQPSLAANVLLANIPRHVVGPLQRAGNLSRQGRPRTVSVMERALVPRALNNDSALPPAMPPGAAAIEPVPAAGTVPGRLLDISSAELRNREVLSLGWDHQKVQALSSLVLKDLARMEHILGIPIPWVGSVFEHGAITLPAAVGGISYPMFQVYLSEMVGPAGKAIPTLTREGGPFTDTSRDLTVHVQFLDPQPGHHQHLTLNSSTYHLAEREPQLYQTFGLSARLSTSLAGQVNVAATAAGSEQRGTFSDLKLMPLSRTEAHTRSMSCLLTWVHALVTIDVDFWNTRGPVKVPSRPSARLRYHMKNALLLALTPTASIRHGLPPVPEPDGAAHRAAAERGHPRHADHGQAGDQGGGAGPRITTVHGRFAEDDPAIATGEPTRDHLSPDAVPGRRQGQRAGRRGN